MRTAHTHTCAAKHTTCCSFTSILKDQETHLRPHLVKDLHINTHFHHNQTRLHLVPPIGAVSIITDSNILHILLHDPHWHPKPKKCHRDTHCSPQPTDTNRNTADTSNRGREGRHYQPALFVDIQPTCWWVISPLGFTERTAALTHTHTLHKRSVQRADSGQLSPVCSLSLFCNWVCVAVKLTHSELSPTPQEGRGLFNSLTNHRNSFLPHAFLIGWKQVLEFCWSRRSPLRGVKGGRCPCL